MHLAGTFWNMFILYSVYIIIKCILNCILNFCEIISIIPTLFCTSWAKPIIRYFSETHTCHVKPLSRAFCIIKCNEAELPLQRNVLHFQGSSPKSHYQVVFFGCIRPCLSTQQSHNILLQWQKFGIVLESSMHVIYLVLFGCLYYAFNKIVGLMTQLRWYLNFCVCVGILSHKCHFHNTFAKCHAPVKNGSPEL